MTTITVPRALLEQVLEALEASRRSHYYCEDTWYSCPKHEDGCSNEMEGDECNCGADEANEKIDQSITALRAALAAPVPHGCHVDLDLEEGMEPDGCVLDEGRPGNCIYARRLHREGKDKTACEYWKPIEVKR